MKHLSLLILPALFAVAAPPTLAHDGAVHLPPALTANKIVQTDAVMRNLWLEHTFWVRNVALATIGGDNAAAEAAEAEAVNNARQIAAAMEAFYGKPASEKLFGLLAGHYGAVKQYLKASIAQDNAQQEAARAAMGENAAQLATFLSGANPHLPYNAVHGMLLAHGGHHISQIAALREHRYADEARIWADMKNHMFAVADAMTGALARQFPAKFE